MSESTHVTPGANARVRFRVATEEDAEAVSTFGRAQFVATFAAQNNPDDLALYLDTAFSPAKQRAEIVAADSVCLLLEVASAESDEWTLAGYSLLHNGEAHTLVTATHPVEVQRFYIAHGWHGLGLAAQLMARVVEQARAWGADVLWLGVWEENPRAVRFYEKQGYAVVGTQIFVVGNDPQTDKVMAKPL